MSCIAEQQASCGGELGASNMPYPEGDGESEFVEPSRAMDTSSGHPIIVTVNHTSKFGRFGRIEFGTSYRPTLKNQDRFDLRKSSANLYSFGVFDGHGLSASSAQVCADNLLLKCAKKPMGTSMDMVSGMDGSEKDVKNLNLLSPKAMLPTEAAMYDGFRAANEDIQELYPDERSGSTATAVFAVHDDEADVWHIKGAWVGDSRAMVMPADRREQGMTIDHQLDNPNERARMEAEIAAPENYWPDGTPKSFIGHRVSKTGVMGPEAIFASPDNVSHLVTRTVGDPHAAPAVSREPEFFEIDVPSNSRLILGSDGMWDVLDEEAIAKQIKFVSDPHLAARKLSRLASKRRIAHCRTADDITVMVINLY